MPWFNQNLNCLRAIKQRRWNKYLQSKNIVSHAQYKESAKRFQSEFIKANCSYERSLFADQNTSSKFYGYVKNQMSVKDPIPSLKNDGSLADTDYQKACEFSVSSSVFVENNNTLPEFCPVCDDSLMEFTCNVRDVIKVIKKLKTNSYSGPYGLSGYFLKNTVARIAGPLCILFRISLSEGNVPGDWNSAFVVPLHKKGDVRCLDNYRPVSLISTVSKILEQIIRSQLLDYMLKNSIIPKIQHGFVPKKSIATNLLECLNDWTSNFDNNVATDIVYLA